jgi:DNA repair protein RadC
MPTSDDSLHSLRQRAIEHGLTDLDMTELVALIANIEPELARFVLHYVEERDGLAMITPAILLDIEGIGPSRAVSICAAVRLGRRLHEHHPRRDERPIIRRPEDAARLVMSDLQDELQELLVVILVDAQNRLVAVETVYIGSLNATVARVSEIFRPAITRNAAGIILVHNHPSGDPTPSPEDVDLTTAIVEAGKLLDIALIDHLIIGSGQWVSLRERKLGF